MSLRRMGRTCADLCSWQRWSWRPLLLCPLPLLLRPLTARLKLPAGPFSSSASSVVVPVGGTASVDVTLTPGVQGGQFGGSLVASGPGVEVRTPLGAVVEEEKYTLSLDVVGRDGVDPWFATVQVIDVATGVSHGYFFTDGARGSVRVPKGKYDVHTMVYGNARDTTLLSSPEVAVGRNDPCLTRRSVRTLLLRGRSTRQVRPRIGHRCRCWWCERWANGQ